MSSISDRVAAGAPKKITALTAEQEAALPLVRDEWLAHGLSTQPADRERAVAGVHQAYRTAGLVPPQIVVWLDSPLAGAFGSWMLGQVRDQVWGQVWGQVGGQVGDQVGRAVYGQHDAGWLAFYDYFRVHCGLDAPARLLGLNQVAQSSSWWWPFRGAVVLTERPTTLRRDGQTRLHGESGPALLYPDGWGIWAWHGVRVPRGLVEGRWSTDDILREPNAEVRRCGIERMGWDRFVVDAGLSQVGATVSDPGNPGHFLALYDVPAAIYDEPVRVLLCDNATPERDGTRRRFGLTVPADISDPVSAAAWTFGLRGADYRQLQHAY